MPDDDVSRMTFTEHLGELRDRLIRSVIAFFVCAVGCYIFSDWLLDQLTQPLRPLQQEGVLEIMDAEGAPAETEAAPERRVHEAEFTVMNPLEYVIIKLKVAGYGGLVVAFPFILYQLAAFVFPGLLPRERKVATVLIFGCSFLAIAGTAVAYAGVFPLVLPYLLEWTPDWVNVQLRMNETMSILIRGILGFAVAFQFPVVVLVLVYMGLLTPHTLRSYRRFALVGMAVVAAILTPPDPVSLFIMLMPLALLYEASIWVSYLVWRRTKAEPGV